MAPDGRDPRARGVDPAGGRPPTDRESPVGEPVIRGDRTLLGERAAAAVAFDSEDPASLAAAATTVGAFAEGDAGTAPADMLRGAAACAALVRGEGSYTAAAERADVTVSFVRKWARVHDLPYVVRRLVAVGELAPSAAKHVARVTGDARFVLAWAAVEHDLSVRTVRGVASAVRDGADVTEALRAEGVEPGAVTVALPTDVHVELRRRAAMADAEPGEVVTAALRAWFDGEG